MKIEELKIGRPVKVMTDATVSECRGVVCDYVNIPVGEIATVYKVQKFSNCGMATVYLTYKNRNYFTYFFANELRKLGLKELLSWYCFKK